MNRIISGIADLVEGSDVSLHTTITLSQVLDHEESKQAFQDFMRQEYALENYLFYQDIIKLKKLQDAEGNAHAHTHTPCILTTCTELRARIPFIYRKYIERNVIHEINISMEARKEATSRFEEQLELTDQPPDVLIFDRCLQEVIDIMVKDSLPRFVRTYKGKKFW